MLEHDEYSAVNLMKYDRASLYDVPTHVLLHEGRSPRLAWLALFLAYYAFLYFKVERAKRGGELNVLESNFKMAGSVLTDMQFMYDKNPESWAQGKVIFPSIETFNEAFVIERWISGRPRRVQKESNF